MNVFTDFINEYGVTILYTIFTALAGWIGIWFKGVYSKYVNNKTTADVVNTCVKAAEQIYKDLHGVEKYNKVVGDISTILADKGITISEIEIKMLVEAAVSEFNAAYKKTETTAEKSE